MRWTLVPLAALAGLLAVAGVAAACGGLSPGDQLVNDQKEVSCTLAFLVANRDGLYFATAGHCGDVNDTVTNPPALGHDGLGAFGRFVFSHLEPRDGGPTGQQAGAPGNDFALIAIDPAMWTSLNPKVCGLDGPTGIYDETPGSGNVRHFGYGTGVGELPQTRPREGVLLDNDNESFYWIGAGVQGDSGSAVIHEDGRALGVLTHLRVSPANNGGTHILRGFQLAHDAGFAPLRLVLAGEDPLLVLAQMRDPQATTPAEPPVATTPTAATPPQNATTARPTNASSPGAASAAANESVGMDADASAEEAVAPAATASGDERRVPAAGPLLVLLVLAVALARRR